MILLDSLNLQMAVLLARLSTVLVAWVLLVHALTGAVPSSDFYSNGESIDDELVASNTQATPLQVGTFNFYGMSYSSVTVSFHFNNNLAVYRNMLQ